MCACQRRFLRIVIECRQTERVNGNRVSSEIVAIYLCSNTMSTFGRSGVAVFLDFSMFSAVPFAGKMLRQKQTRFGNATVICVTILPISHYEGFENSTRESGLFLGGIVKSSMCLKTPDLC
ncbi:hypothetical protein HanPI659440_Chr15g0595061 [Helianthus annuus]|nr:hypothetical protein HanPI659440_Chr15g0595061 [Helianthus annuus]